MLLVRFFTAKKRSVAEVLQSARSYGLRRNVCFRCGGRKGSACRIGGSVPRAGTASGPSNERHSAPLCDCRSAKRKSRCIIPISWSRRRSRTRIAADHAGPCQLGSGPDFGSGESAAGTYGKTFDGFDVTESLPIPRRIGAFAAIENITSGALSVSERPFHSAKPNTAGVPIT